jgi:hypothetical protein
MTNDEGRAVIDYHASRGVRASTLVEPNSSATSAPRRVDLGRRRPWFLLVPLVILLNYDGGLLPPWAGFLIDSYSLILSVALGVLAVTLRPRGDLPWRGRERSAWLYLGWWSGVVLGLAATMVQVALIGWIVLPVILPRNLILWPCMGVVAVAAWSWEPRDGSAFLARPRFSLRFLMAVVAFLGLYLGLTQEATRISFNAREYNRRYLNAKQLMQTYEVMSAQSPSLEAAGACRRMVKYQSALAEKYDPARQRPWVDVASDPPFAW